MRRIAAVSFIVVYLSALGWGIVSHTLHIGAYQHPAMYFVVWDMFCGWSGYSVRHDIIAEGESGTYYDLSPAPWGTFKPFGQLDRHDYDSYSAHTSRLAKVVLDNTKHEPITRIFLVEQQWSKRYNIPDYTWSSRHHGPKDKQVYYHIQKVLSPEAEVLKCNSDWQTVQTQKFILSNPKIQSLARRGRSFLQVQPKQRNPHQMTGPESFVKPVARRETEYPLAN